MKMSVHLWEFLEGFFWEKLKRRLRRKIACHKMDEWVWGNFMLSFLLGGIYPLANINGWMREWTQIHKNGVTFRHAHII